ncbi:MAG: hypothetical protein CM1200mP20_10080 [Pseudomonadota bacterium]|nr:MAG: hypothetical protein CM1200mP20_10080 [Pseudomonadota bacterium]
MIYGAIDVAPLTDESRPARPLSYFDGADELENNAKLLLAISLPTSGNRHRQPPGGIEYVNPSITQALESAGLEVIEASPYLSGPRVIKSEDE